MFCVKAKYAKFLLIDSQKMLSNRGFDITLQLYGTRFLFFFFVVVERIKKLMFDHEIFSYSE